MKAPLINIFNAHALMNVKNKKDEVIVPIVIKVVRAVEMGASKQPIVEKKPTKEEVRKAKREAEIIGQYLEETGYLNIALRDEAGSVPEDFAPSFAGTFVCLEGEHYNPGFIKTASPADPESAPFRARIVCMDMGSSGARFVLQMPGLECEFTVLGEDRRTTISPDTDVYKALKENGRR